jgi:hypothetical protein
MSLGLAYRLQSPVSILRLVREQDRAMTIRRTLVALFLTPVVDVAARFGVVRRIDAPAVIGEVHC